MAVLMSLYNVWCNKILDGSKPLEFRNNIGKDFKVGDKIYLYETSKNNGRKKVVGEVIIKDIVKLQKSKMGFYNFLGYYVKNILKDKDLYKKVETVYEYDLPNYDAGYKFYWLFLPEVLDELKTHNKLPDYFDMTPEEAKRFQQLQKKAQKLIEDCDDWLRSIGYYNEYEESFYKNYIEVTNPIKYTTPLELSDFKNLKGSPITRAPQSWCYVQNK